MTGLNLGGPLFRESPIVLHLPGTVGQMEQHYVILDIRLLLQVQRVSCFQTFRQCARRFTKLFETSTLFPMANPNRLIERNKAEIYGLLARFLRNSCAQANLGSTSSNDAPRIRAAANLGTN